MTENHRLSDELHETLRDRAGAFAPAPIGMDDVLHRARGVKRRRRTTAAVVSSAAAVAIAVPVALALGHGPESSYAPAPASSGVASTSATPSSSATPPPSPTPSPVSSEPTSSQPPMTPTAHPSRAAVAAGLTLQAVPRSGSAGVGWLEGSTWHDPSGALEQLPDATYSAVVPFRGGFLVATPHQGNGEITGAVANLTLLDSSMQPQWVSCGADRFALNGDHTLAAFSQLSGCVATGTDTLHTAATSGTSDTVRAVPAGQLAEPVGQTNQALVYNLLGLKDGKPAGAWYANLAEQQPAKRIPGMASASAVNASRQQVAGLRDRDGRTSVVADLPTGRVLWQKQDWGLGAFSSDGRYVVGAHSAGGAPDTYAILDSSTGAFVQQLDATPAGMQVVATAWNPDDSLLLLVHQGDKEAILRLAVDGALTRVSDVLPANAAHAVVFATQP